MLSLTSDNGQQINAFCESKLEHRFDVVWLRHFALLFTLQSIQARLTYDSNINRFCRHRTQATCGFLVSFEVQSNVESIDLLINYEGIDEVH